MLSIFQAAQIRQIYAFINGKLIYDKKKLTIQIQNPLEKYIRTQDRFWNVGVRKVID
jgi:hypothetical protein